MENNANGIKIYTVRGQKVMLDADLAEIYGYETKYLNRQVQRNIKKFEGEEFMFQLTREETEYCSRCHFGTLDNDSGGDNFLRSKNLTLKRDRGQNIKYLPYAFTEQGIYMLMTVLKGELAIKQSRMLVMAFKTMKDYIVENKILLDHRENLSLAAKVISNSDKLNEAEKKIQKIDIKVNKIANEMSEVVRKTEISPVFLDFSKTMDHKEFLLLEGEPVQAKEAYMEIYKHAKKEIYIIDNYVNIKTLHLLQLVKQNMEITFFTDNARGYLRQTDLDDFKKERPDLKIKFIKTYGKIHDRFIVLDEKTVYQAGGSSKDAGAKISFIHEVAESFLVDSLIFEIEKLKRNPELKLKR